MFNQIFWHINQTPFPITVFIKAWIIFAFSVVMIRAGIFIAELGSLYLIVFVLSILIAFIYELFRRNLI